MLTAQAASNKATCRRFHDLWNTGDAQLISKTIDEVVEPAVLLHTPLQVATGPQALKQVMAMLHRVLPDLHLTVEDLIAEGDKVVARNAVTGTTRVNTSATHQRANPAPTKRSLSSALSTVESLRSGGPWTSSR
jgi:ketosteroid isomerase-like protein